MNPLDTERLQQALLLAEAVIGATEPNPRVGCVIGTEQGQVLGRGATQRAGSAHAEVMALRDAASAGHAVRGATAWVTLEPCSHHGRTPPCCDALIDAGLARVVVAVQDPFHKVAGTGIARLRSAGIHVEMADADMADAARELNIGFFSRLLRRRPWVRVKVAASMDGRTALPNGVSQWITGPEARADGHAWRRRAGAVLTGIGTVLADDPRMDVRLVPTATQPLRVVVDSTGRTPQQARLLQGPGQAMVVTATVPGSAHTSEIAARYPPTTECLALPDAAGQQVDLAALLTLLAARDVNEVHVEAGARLNGALAAQGLVDEWLLYLAPLLLGPGLDMATWPALQTLDQVRRLHLMEAGPMGCDLRIRLRTAAGMSRA